MRVVYMGTPDFAVPALMELAASRHEVSLVVTQPDRVRGRGKAVSFSPVKEAAEKLGIPVFQPEKVRREESLQRIREEHPDVIVVAAYGQILPKLRGAAPIQQAVLQGERESGITIMQMDEGIDTGDILLQEAVALDPKETAESLYEKLSRMGGPMICRALDMAEEGSLRSVPQPSEGSSYAGMLTSEMGEICWEEEAAVIERKIRGYYPWPCARTKLHGKSLKIFGADVDGDEERKRLAAGLAPGTVLGTDRGAIYAVTGDGVLKITQVQLEGKKRMDVSAFLLGTKVSEGERLG